MVRFRHAACALLALLALTPAGGAQVIDFETPGADEALTETLRRSSALLGAEREGTIDPQDLFAAALAEYARLVGTLYGEGYYSPVISIRIDGREAAGIPPLDSPDRIGRIAVRVDPGPAFAFGTARVAPLAAGTVLPPEFRAGARARSGAVTAAVGAGIDAWRDAGNAKARVAAQRVVANHPAARLDADVTLDPGPRLRFGPLTVEGAERLRERRIRRIAGLPEGRVFSPAELERAAERLRRTGVFRSVTLAEDEAVTPPDLLGITATLVEERPRRYSFGAEIASLDGATLSALWLHRNLLGGAERLTVEGQVTNLGAQDSGTDYSLGVALERPATINADTTARVAAEVERLDEADFDADTATLGLTLTRIASERFSTRIGLEYGVGRYEDATGRYSFRQLSLPLGATYDTRDDRLDATRGSFVDAEVRPFLGFGDSASGTRIAVDGRAYRGFGEDARFVLAGRIQGGAVLGAALERTPRDYLFYSGGGGTVRGQPYQSLGATLPGTGAADPVTLGGTTFAAASVELRARITDTIGLVGFADAGAVGIGGLSGAGSDVHAGAGLGLRYDTGFGPIRLDVAAPVAGDTGEGVQIYVGIGQAF